MIRNIVFDIGRVLVEFDPAAYLRTFGFPPATAQALEQIVFGRDWVLHDRGDYATIAELRAALIARHPALTAEINAVLDGDWRAMHILKQDSAAYLAALKRRGYRIFLLSNLSVESHAYVAQYEFMSLADGGVFSYREHAVKPEAAIYRALLERYGLVPEETVFLDDNAGNIAAGAAFGLHCVLFTDLDSARTQTEALLKKNGEEQKEKEI